jgi:protein O-mannosyl-transferase
LKFLMRPFRRDALFVLLAALAASVGGLLNDFVYDDLPIIRDNARLHSLANWHAILSRPYWPPPFVEQLYRPVAGLFLALQYSVGGGQPVVFRLVSYALYATCAIAVLALGRRVVRPRPALLAALLFAIHPVHVEAVALGVNQAELIVALLALIMTSRYIDARRRHDLRARDWSIVAILYLIATLSKENGFVLPGLLATCELVIDDGSTFRDRISASWRGLVALGIVAGGALAVRAAVLSGNAIGASAALALRGLTLSGRMMTMLQVVPMWFRLLVWPAHLRADYAPDEIVRPAHIGWPEVVGVLLICAAITAVWVARKRAPAVSFGIAWCIVALLPVSNIVPTGVVLAERTLFLPSVGVVIAAAGAGQWLVDQGWGFVAGTRRILLAAVAVLIGLGIIRSESRQLVWNSRHLVVVRHPR